MRTTIRKARGLFSCLLVRTFSGVRCFPNGVLAGLVLAAVLHATSVEAQEAPQDQGSTPDSSSPSSSVDVSPDEGAGVRDGSAIDVNELLAHFDDEPSVEELIDELRGAAIDVTAVERLVRRARLSALLPELRTFVRRGQGVDLDERSGNLQTSTDDSLTLGATATWRLGQLVFRRGEVSLARESARRDEAMQRRRQALIRAYFQRRRLQLEQLVLGEALERTMAILELTAVLDALTDGAFSRSARQTPAAEQVDN